MADSGGQDFIPRNFPVCSDFIIDNHPSLHLCSTGQITAVQFQQWACSCHELTHFLHVDMLVLNCFVLLFWQEWLTNPSSLSQLPTSQWLWEETQRFSVWYCIWAATGYVTFLFSHRVLRPCLQVQLIKKSYDL